MEKSNLEELEDLTASLHFSEMVSKESLCPFFQVKTSKGNVFGFVLFSNEKISIIRVYGDSKSELEFHTHDNKVEWFGVYDGSVRIDFKDGEASVFLKNGDAFKIDKNKSHRTVYLESSWAWVILNPSENYGEN